MSGGFELQPQDGGPRVALAPGETVIGRGPLLGITDKRVSRRHAILEVVDGKLRIKPLHKNPCYYQSSEKSQLLPLKTDIWCWLNPGDRFSLLVDKYIFCVLSTHSEMEMECTLRNSQMLDEDDILNETPKSSSVDLPDKTPSAPQLERSTKTARTQTTANNVSFIGESRDLNKQQPNPSERKRILPTWMLTENSSDRNLSGISGDNNVTQESEKERVCKDKTQRNITQQGKKRSISSGSAESTSAEQDTGKKCRNDQEESIISSKITDKRVSRRHAILEVVDGKLRIKPLHKNPCYYQSSEKSQLLPLKTDIWCWLNPGDRFSLLVDKYIFCVLSTHSEMEMECTLRNSQMLDEDDILNETPKSSSVDLPDKTPSAPQLERSTKTARTQTTANNVSFIGESRDLNKQQPNPSERKRILPTWMLTENSSDRNLSGISGDNNVTQESEKERVCKDKTQRNITQQGKKRSISSGSAESTSAEQDTGKKCRNDDQEESIISSKEMPQSFSAATLHNTEVNDTKTNPQRSEIPVEALGKVSEHKIITKGSSNEDSMARSCSESCSSTLSKSFCDEPQKSHPESSSNTPSPECVQAKATDSVPNGSEENKVQRTSCMYGANCYRKNPVHFQHFSHPGDSDYGGVNITCQDEADDRPECPYGASCYRKNPQHKIEYRHSTFPVRSISDEDDNEYNLNDSFIDDEEEEYEPTDEDSDWEPEKGDLEKEDMEGLLKEAKKIMKRKK